jgi:hypothetical protein
MTSPVYNTSPISTISVTLCNSEGRIVFASEITSLERQLYDRFYCAINTGYAPPLTTQMSPLSLCGISSKFFVDLCCRKRKRVNKPIPASNQPVAIYHARRSPRAVVVELHSSSSIRRLHPILSKFHEFVACLRTARYCGLQLKS